MFRWKRGFILLLLSFINQAFVKSNDQKIINGVALRPLYSTNTEDFISKLFLNNNMKDSATFIVSFGSQYIRYKKNALPELTDLKHEWEGRGWKGERISTQLLIWANKPIAKLKLICSDLNGDNKMQKIGRSAVSFGFIRYVITDSLNKSGHGCGIEPSTKADSSLVADGIDFIPFKTIAGKSLQPVWVTIQIPEDAKAGSYQGVFKIEADEKEISLPFSIQVCPLTLPAPSKWSFYLDLWQNPYSIARIIGAKPFSRKHMNAMKPYMQMLAKAGQKAITVSMIYDPWRGQTYDIYSSMIRWVKKRQGGWRYDYTIFDKWVRFMMNNGIDQQINCYSMVPWNNRFYYYDEKIEKDTFLVAKTGTPEFEAHWKPMLIDFEKHLKKRGWFKKTAIAMDERPLEDMEKVISIVKGVDPLFKIALAGSYHREISNDIYDYSITEAEHYDSDVLHQRIAKGMPTTFYTSCYEGYPNTFTFSAPAESAWMGWLAMAKGLTGYLRWAYNCWPQNPLLDSRYSSWSAGDTYLVYPGPGSSIRYEELISGIQDFEKMSLLRKKFTENGDERKLAKLDNILEPFESTVSQKQNTTNILEIAREQLWQLGTSE